MTEKEEWVERYKKAHLDNVVGTLKRTFMRQTGRDNALWEEIEIEAETVIGSEEHKKEKIDIEKINKVLNYALNDKGEMLKYKHLRDLDIDEITPNYDKINKELTGIAALEGQFLGVISVIERQDRVNAEVVKDVKHKLSEILSSGPSDIKDDGVTKKLEDFLQDLSEADTTLAEDRKTIYDFWRKVHKEYKKLEDAIDNFIEKVGDNPEIADKVSKLKTPPNYIVQIPPQPVRLKKVERRIADILEELGGKPSAKAKLRMEISHDSPPATKYRIDGTAKDTGTWVTKPDPKKIVGQSGEPPVYGVKDMSMERDRILGPDTVEFIDDMGDENLKADPILAYVITNELLTTGIALHELDIFEEQIGKYIDQLGDSVAARSLAEKLEDLKDEASSFEGNAFLPLTKWVTDLEKHTFDGRMRLEGQMVELDKIQKETSEFFELLGDILLTEKGQSQVSQEPFSAKGDPLSDKDKPTSIEGYRAQPGQRAESRLEEADIKELTIALNRYYFAPLDTEYFVNDEKPEFIHKVQGRFSYNVLRFNLGKSPAQYAEKKAAQGIANHVNITSIKRLIQFFEDAKQGTINENWSTYISSVEKVVRVLDKLLPDSKKSNKTWAARSIRNTLKRHTDNTDLSEIKLDGKPIDDLLDDDDDEYEKGDSMSNLKRFLGSPSLITFVARKQKYSPVEGKELGELCAKLLGLLTNINKHDPITSALLIAHDSIRKMQGKGVVYGTLCLDNIEDMDYIINKVSNENKVEVNSMEINTIVKSLNSIFNLSQKHGVSEEIVYKIKGLCR